ncbi:hypothetical protein VTN49DRAFT_5858 [Thermomyces lanuginosus]|uniref:uncharacterized protein n=1 Tax=Thermomyces lanuginosus TaxID=5541 RepID=UPI0037445E0A
MSQSSQNPSSAAPNDQPVKKPGAPSGTSVTGQSRTSSAPLRTGHLTLDTFSPVNEHGSFEFDRVLKQGKVLCRMKSRHAFKASWKPVFLVLRPNLLSVYKDEDEARLRISITLSDVTAVAPVHSPRSHREHVFGIFTPSKNYRFQAASEQEAEDWLEKIRNEARIDEEEEAILAETQPRAGGYREGVMSEGEDHVAAVTASELSDIGEADHDRSPSSLGVSRSLSVGRNLPAMQEYSGNEVTEFSDLSDTPATRHQRASRADLPKRSRSAREHNPSYLGPLSDPDKVICHGYLQCLRSKHGVRQWKKVWVVLRPVSLALYKDDREYCAIKIVPMSQVINAAEIDPISKSKNFCLQVITEDRPIYRFSAPDEESLARWLGALKSIIVARKKALEMEKAQQQQQQQQQRHSQPPTTVLTPATPEFFQPLH